jgi:hypothetical protein
MRTVVIANGVPPTPMYEAVIRQNTRGKMHTRFRT